MGPGPITAVAFLSAVDDADRFKHARDVGPYLGLTPTRYQSGETDRQGRNFEVRRYVHPHLPI